MKNLGIAFFLLVSGSMASAGRDLNAVVIWDYIHSSSQDITQASDQCLALFGPDDQGSYTLREVHNSVCGGDPGIMPALAFLQVKTSNGQSSVLKYDVANDKNDVVFTEPTPK